MWCTEVMNAGPVQAASRRHPLVLVGAGALLFSTGPVLVAGANVPGPVLGFWRLWIGSGVLTLLCLGYGRMSGRWPDRRGLRWAVVCGIVFAGHQLMLLVAVKRTSVVDVTLMQVLGPVVVAVFAARLFGERPGLGFRAWSALAIVGAVIVALGGAAGPEGDPLGMLLAGGNVVGYAVYFVWSKQARDHIDVVPFLWGTTVTAAVIMSGYVAMTGLHPGDASGGAIGAAAAMAVGPGIAGHFLTTWPLRWVDANIPPLLQLGTPFVAGFLAWVFVGQGVAAAQVLGGAITMAGVAGALRSPSGQHLAEEEELTVTG
jgi:drug/metabolite transporter (DMT)-like permease